MNPSEGDDPFLSGDAFPDGYDPFLDGHDDGSNFSGSRSGTDECLLDNADYGDESSQSFWSDNTSPTKHLHNNEGDSFDIAGHLHSEGEISFGLSSQPSESELSDFDDEHPPTPRLQPTEKSSAPKKSTQLHHMKETDFDTSLRSLINPPEKFDPTPSNILFVGLWYCGFDADRQMKSNLDRNMRRFLTFFGVGPQTIHALFADLRDRNPSLMFKDLMMTLNWFKLYDQEPVLEGRWGFCSEYIGPKLKEIGRMIQALLPEKIKFEYSDDDTIIMSLDTVNYIIQEPRKTPSTSWFDPKSHSAGLVSDLKLFACVCVYTFASISKLTIIFSLQKYEHGLSLTKPQQIWLRGPKPAATDDITFFRGGKKNVNISEWDRSALYWRIPDKKRAIADNGYRGEADKILTTKDEHSTEMKKWIGRVKARQETLHTRLKSFQILQCRFRHGKTTEKRLDLHKMVVECVCIIIQFDWENGHPPMDV